MNMQTHYVQNRMILFVAESKTEFFLDLLTMLLNFSITSTVFTITNEMHMIPTLLNYLIH